MITVILLVIIYLAFISLGLPDSLLGVAWPIMQQEWQVSLDTAGLIAMLVTGSTIISSFLSGHIIKRFGTGKVTLISCIMTGGALLGISYAPSYIWLFVLAIPLGFGAGSVDTALNNYVALHFKAHHMNWLHSFWGVGATMGPLIMGNILLKTSSWRLGYRTIASIQLVLASVLLISLPLWFKHRAITKAANTDTHEEYTSPNQKGVIKIPGVIYALLTFVFYCAAELSVGLWGSSYLVEMKSLTVDTAATWVAMYYGGITIGRFICGFISFRLTNTQMIRSGIYIALIGTLLLLLPLPNFILMIAFILVGLGLSPIFPAMIHATPTRFGKTNSQTIIGYQMAFGFMGSAFLPPLLGFIMKNTSMLVFPIFLVMCNALMLISSEKINRITIGKEVVSDE